MSYSNEVKELAYKIDPECWVSYSGQPVGYKRAMDKRRVFSLDIAEHTLRERAKIQAVHAPEKENTELSDQETLCKHYNEVIIPMCEGTTVKPWECVRYIGPSSERHGFLSKPNFGRPKSHYEFALTVHLNRPVWVGSVLYNTKNKDAIRVVGVNPGKKIVTTLQGVRVKLADDWREWAVWDEPVKQKAPTRVEVGYGNWVTVPKELRVAGSTVVFTFSSSKDAVEFYKVFSKLSDEEEA